MAKNSLLLQSRLNFYFPTERYSGSIAYKDVPVLVSAINGKSDYLITGDIKDFKKLRTSPEYQFKIVNPGELISEVINKIL